MNRSLQNTAAEIAAAALFELFPGIELLGGGATSLGFAYMFCSEADISAQFENLVADKIRQIVRERRSVQVYEMMAVSAREFLVQKGFAARAQSLGQEGLVQVVQMGSFYDLCEGNLLSNSSEAAFFQLFPLTRLEDGTYRLSGCVAESKEELRAFLKRLRSYETTNHMEEGKKDSFWFFAESVPVWFGRGLQKQRDVVEVLRASLFGDAVEVLCADQKVLQKYFFAQPVAEVLWRPSALWNPEEGFFSGVGGTVVQIHFFNLPSNGGERSVQPEDTLAKEKEKIISCLQRIEKTLNILGFQYSLRLLWRGKADFFVRLFLQFAEGKRLEKGELEEGKAAPGIEFLVEDNLGRKWAAFEIERHKKAFCVKASVERLVALLIEQSLYKKDKK